MTNPHVVVAGGTGLVGTRLIQALLKQGRQVTLLTRHPSRVTPSGIESRPWEDAALAVEGAEAVFNLAGAGIAEARWTPDRKALLLSSRVGTTERLVEAIRLARQKPKVLVNASAVGFYGGRDGAPLDEATPQGDGFLAELCRAWEGAADPVLPLGVRLVKPRLGVVLATEGGALPKMMLPMRLFQGAALGSGQQGLSWIHIEDLVNLLLETAWNPAWSGPVNATAPFPVSNDHFTRELGKAMHRPVLPIPAWVTRTALPLFLGEMADEMLLKGAFVVPRRALSQGFAFKFPTIQQALNDLIP